MKILVADDSPTMRLILVNSLKRLGYGDVVVACDGREVLEKFDPTIKFIIIDWNMPGMRCSELTRQLRARPEGKTVPILIMSVSTVIGDTLDALDAGADHFITKPFNPEQMNASIEVALLSRRSIRPA